jgi:hypothetical protein
VTRFVIIGGPTFGIGVVKTDIAGVAASVIV